MRFTIKCIDSPVSLNLPELNQAGSPQSENLFVPFFTTKQGGSGIGLLLSRRIAEMHDGWLTLELRENTEGAAARL